MISKTLMEDILGTALSTGGDYAEVFVEDTLRHSLILSGGQFDSILSGNDFGASVRILRGTQSVYAYTNDVSRESMLELARRAAKVLGEIGRNEEISLTERYIANYSPTLLVPSSVPNRDKGELVRRAYSSARQYHNSVVQAIVSYKDCDQKLTLATSDGVYLNDRRIYTTLGVRSIASRGGENEVCNKRYDVQGGLEMFDTWSPELIGEQASQVAVMKLDAVPSPVGELPVVLSRGHGGIFLHEACGHSLESSSVAGGGSVFSGKLGQRIATDKITVFDDGTMPGAWGSINVDDEGLPAQKNLLIENGILKGYMIDRLGARKMGMKPTGSGRKESYRFAPTSRMTNTYIVAGEDEEQDIIASVDYGVFAKEMGGGTANPQTSSFNFNVQEAYLIEKGKITSPIKGATLMGMGVEAMMNIEMVGNKLDFDGGFCGASSGSLPVSNGQPMIKISKLVVGGK
ncbi:TldD/PmbA family protein [Paenibacillus sanguinis]|uniref:TldD/PmbA family protein n=1 Tax=Paenibacillus sanguinis TaxID=225906 RepID=UPI00036F1B75|nr:TldD/PmbA family protein [Paenibacillus sanguinis]